MLIKDQNASISIVEPDLYLCLLQKLRFAHGAQKPNKRDLKKKIPKRETILTSDSRFSSVISLVLQRSYHSEYLSLTSLLYHSHLSMLSWIFSSFTNQLLPVLYKISSKHLAALDVITVVRGNVCSNKAYHHHWVQYWISAISFQRTDDSTCNWLTIV